MFQSLFSMFLLTLVMFFGSVSKAEPRLVLTERNTLVLRGVVDSESVSKVIMALQKAPKANFILYLSSPGGDVVSGNQLVDAIDAHVGKITCYADFAASMAFVILQACDERYVGESSVIMQHVASYGVRGQAPNNLSLISFLEILIQRMDEKQAKRIGMSLAEFKEKTRNDWWLDGVSAVENNTADSIALTNCTKELTEKTYTEEAIVIFFKVTLTWSACPIVRHPLKTDISMLFGDKNSEKSKKQANKALNDVLENRLDRPLDSESLNQLLSKKLKRVR